ncbi:hypothetical protein NEUTE2DRAFT_76098 [Neurospora tetrasperma FGSC 2509]|nr:hypothetical protein NEUTE2DRAFT_76098 [Neurospora tetrasperma FGSC 2509]
MAWKRETAGTYHDELPCRATRRAYHGRHDMIYGAMQQTVLLSRPSLIQPSQRASGPATTRKAAIHTVRICSWNGKMERRERVLWQLA